MTRFPIADDEVRVWEWLLRVLQRRGHSGEEPLCLKTAMCCKGDSVRQVWRTQ